jgi:hypothetical protein
LPAEALHGGEMQALPLDVAAATSAEVVVGQTRERLGSLDMRLSDMGYGQPSLCAGRGLDRPATSSDLP